MRSLLAASLALLFPLAALSQEAATELPENPHAARFRDVERGFFVGFDAGYLGLFDTPTKNPAAFPYAGKGGGSAGGLLLAISVGVDLGTRLSVSVLGLGINETADLNYGSFSLYGGGADVRYAWFSQRDSNDYERFFAFVHGRLAYAGSSPAGLFADHEFLAALGPGVEYYTRLRHFSVGVVADVVYAAPAGTAGFAIYPTVRYTF